VIKDVKATRGTLPSPGPVAAQPAPEARPGEGGTAQGASDTAILPRSRAASSKSGLALAAKDTLRGPKPQPKSSVLESQTAQFRGVVKQHETSNSFTALDAVRHGQELFSFLSESRDHKALSDGTAAGKPPSKDTNRFAERVRPQVAALGDWVLRQPPDAKLTPANIYEQALKINKGDAFNARLTAHNMMKEVAATESGHPQTDIARNNAINQRLINLRDPQTKGDGNYGDKMGPWYHLFAVGVISGAARGTLESAGAAGVVAGAATGNAPTAVTGALAVLGSGWAADRIGETANEMIKGRTNGPGRVNDPQEEAVRLWANRVFD
jgi:hypothetical protein